MANVMIRTALSVQEQINQMKADAQYDVSDNDSACVPDLSALSAIHGPAAAQKVPKVFLSNDCIFNCAYCGCRSSRDCRSRYAHTPQELARIAAAEAQSNGRGVFITSAIYKNPDYTQELIVRTLRILRSEYSYGGYVHAKVMPGADPLLIREAGRYANRLSVNIEVARSEGYRHIAKQKKQAKYPDAHGADQ